MKERVDALDKETKQYMVNAKKKSVAILSQDEYHSLLSPQCGYVDARSIGQLCDIMLEKFEIEEI